MQQLKGTITQLQLYSKKGISFKTQGTTEFRYDLMPLRSSGTLCYFYDITHLDLLPTSYVMVHDVVLLATCA